MKSGIIGGVILVIKKCSRIDELNVFFSNFYLDCKNFWSILEK